MNDVTEHEQGRTFREIVITPDHANRTESTEFRSSKERLREDGHYKCWVCGASDDIQVHHFGVEWSLANVADWNKAKSFVEEWDPYGYGRLLRDKPLTSADDIRNLMVLCQEHHTGIDHENGGSGTGIHDLTFPSWIAQKLCVTPPIPQRGESAEKAMARIKSHERSDC